jgi:ABC-2 type transport system permease protein
MSALNVAEEMNVALPERADPLTTHPTRPFLWSIRRELWENPSILVAPAAVASLLVLAILFAAIRFTGPAVLQFGPETAPLSTVAVLPLIPIPALLGVTMVLVAIFYSLDGLLSERRDRSVLFWKSLPVSDTTTVLSKIAVPMVILPIVTFILAIATQIAVFFIESAVLLAHHASLASAWVGIPVLALLGLTAYTPIVVTLWYAPIYAWFCWSLRGLAVCHWCGPFCRSSSSHSSRGLPSTPIMCTISSVIALRASSSSPSRTATGYSMTKTPTWL